MLLELLQISPLLIVTFVGLLTMLVGAFAPAGSFKGWLGYLTGFGFLAALVAIWWLWDRTPVAFESPWLSNALRFDAFGLALMAVIAVGGLLTTLTAIHYLPAQRSDHAEYYSLVSFSVLGMMCLVTANDLLTLFIALEVMSIAVYILAGFKRQSPYAIEAAMKYFILGSFASALLLLGIAFVWGVTGAITLPDIARVFAFGNVEEGLGLEGVAHLGMVLILGAFAFKIAAAPFHMWTPDVYEGAPASVSGLMAVAVKTAAFGALARVLLTCFGDDQFREGAASWETLVAILAVVSMFGGNLMALAQKNLKRVLAYSAIAHTGYILIALLAAPAVADGTLTLNALGAGLVFYLLAYTLANAAAFGVAAAIGANDNEDASDPSYSGLAYRHPALAVVLTISVLSLLGIPVTAGFIGKLTIFSEVLQSPTGDYLWLVILAVINSIISAYYYLRIIVVAFMKPEVQPVETVTSRPLGWSLGLAAALTVILGLIPSSTLEVAHEAGRSLVHSTTPGLIGAAPVDKAALPSSAAAPRPVEAETALKDAAQEVARP